MARQERDREDLMAEATALTRRAEWIPPGEEPVVTGFRNNGAFSIYFGPDPCFHFTPKGELRRAFANGYLFRSEGTTLSRLLRQREELPAKVELLRSDLGSEELNDFWNDIRSRLERFQNWLKPLPPPNRAVPPDDSHAAQVLAFLESIPRQPSLAPRLVRRKRK